MDFLASLIKEEPDDIPEYGAVSLVEVKPENILIKMEEDALEMTTKKKKPYECHICDKSYGTSGSLRIHIITHILKTDKNLDENGFKCEICCKMFSTNTYLRLHLSVHDRKFPCKICGKLFPFPSKVKYHMKRKHSGIKKERKPYTRRAPRKQKQSPIALLSEVIKMEVKDNSMKS